MERGFGCVSRHANGFFGTLALRDVGIDQHEAAAGYWVPAHLDDPTVGPRALDAHLPPGIFDGATQLRFEIGRVLAAVGKITEIVGKARPPREEGVGQFEHLLEIAVPRGKPRFGVKHDDAVAHIVEGDAQLGLALAQLVEQPRILDRDHRLIGEAGGQLDLLVREGLDARADKPKYADQCLLAQQRNAEQRAVADDLLSFPIGVFRVLQHIGDVDRSTLQRNPAAQSCRGRARRDE